MENSCIVVGDSFLKGCLFLHQQVRGILAHPCVADESPPTCSVFLGEQGLELFMSMLQALEEVDNDNRIQVETKILGLLVNGLSFNCVFAGLHVAYSKDPFQQ